MNIEKERCVRSLKKLGMEHPEEFLGDYGQKGPFLALEEGKLTPAGFREALREYLPAGVTDEQIDDAFNDFLVGIPVERLKELEKLHRNHRIFLLSNTNKIMWDSKIAEEFRKDGHDREYYFDGCVTSFDVKCCKPCSSMIPGKTARQPPSWDSGPHGYAPAPNLQIICLPQKNETGTRRSYRDV